MATTTNYTINGAARKVDLYIMGAFDFSSQATQQLQPTMGCETGGKVCAGITKLAQKAAQLLLTSDISYDESWGTGLSYTLNTSSQFQLQKTFGETASGVTAVVVSSLRSQETSDMPNDERISSLIVNSWNLDKLSGTLTLSLTLTALSGDTLPIVVPISIVP